MDNVSKSRLEELLKQQKLKREIKEYEKELDDIKSEIDNFNNLFIVASKEEHDRYFDVLATLPARTPCRVDWSKFSYVKSMLVDELRNENDIFLVACKNVVFKGNIKNIVDAIDDIEVFTAYIDLISSDFKKIIQITDNKDITMSYLELIKE